MDLQGNHGRMRLIVGNRGIGKSTCLRYLHDYVVSNGGPGKSVVFDAGLHIPKLIRTADPNERIGLLLELLAISISHDQHSSITDVIKQVDKKGGGPYFLFVDNLDRFYQAEDDLLFVKSFLQVADPILKALCSQMVIVLSCAPEWESFLRSDDLGYVNFENRITLDPLSEEEVADLLEYRARSLGLEPSKVYTPDLIPVIRTASRGNSRSVIQLLERAATSSQDLPGPITAALFERTVRSELFDASIEGLRELASTSSRYSWGVNELWRYFDTLQKTGTDSQQGILVLSLGCSKLALSAAEVKPAGLAWWRVAHRLDRDTSSLNEQVRTAILEWSHRTGIERETLLTAFSEHPFSTSMTDVQAYVDEFREALQHLAGAVAVFDGSIDAYLKLNSKKGGEWERVELVRLGWDCVEGLLLSMAAVWLKRFPTNLQTQLRTQDTARPAFQKLIEVIENTYEVGGKVNPYHVELVAIFERIQNVRDDPKVVSLWETQQLEDYRSHVLSTYEGLIRSLRPRRILALARESVGQILAEAQSADESKILELKSSLLWDATLGKPNPELEYAAIKTIQAFLNTEGGRLVIGLGPNRQVVGIETDYPEVDGHDRDGFERRIIDRSNAWLGIVPTSQVDVRFGTLEGRDVAVVTVQPFPEPVFMTRKGKKECWVRVGNTTRQLSGEELELYVQTRNTPTGSR